MWIVMVYLFLLALLAITSSQDNCQDILCSNVIDYVCGAIEYTNGTINVQKYQNICIMRKTSCTLKPDAVIHKIDDILCHINKRQHYGGSGRRDTDFQIVGGHQACNHTCPTYCVDTYEPACACIWAPNMESSKTRPMINHCHIDLFSCSTGRNVTILPLLRCYENPRALMFMKEVAALKSLKLLEDSQK